MRIAQQVHLGKPWHVSPNGNFHEENYDSLWSPGISIWGYTILDNSTLCYTIKIDKTMSVIQRCLDHGDLMLVFRIVRETMGLIPHQSGFIRGWHCPLCDAAKNQGDAKKHAASCKKSPGKSLGWVWVPNSLQGWWKDWGNCPNIGQHFRCVKYDVEFTQLYLSGILKKIGTKDFTPRLGFFFHGPSLVTE